MLKQKDVVIIDIPKYEERSIKIVWHLVKDNDDFLEYFPDYSNKQVSDRDFIFSLLWSFRFNVIQKMVDDARKIEHLKVMKMKINLCKYKRHIQWDF